MIIRDLWQRFFERPELNEPEIKIEMTRRQYNDALSRAYQKGWNDCRKQRQGKPPKKLNPKPR